MKNIKNIFLFCALTLFLYNNVKSQNIDTVFLSSTATDSTINAHIHVYSPYEIGFVDYTSVLSNDTINMSACYWYTMSSVMTEVDTFLIIPISPINNSYILDLKIYNSSSKDSCTFNILTDSLVLSFSTPLDVNDNIKNTGIFVYPNPTNDILLINNTSNLLISNTSLINSNGKVVLNYKGYIEKINTSDLLYGVYLLELKTEKGSFIKKIIVQ